MTFNEKREVFLEALEKCIDVTENEYDYEAAQTVRQYKDIMIRKPLSGGRGMVRTSKRQRFADMLKEGPVPVAKIFNDLGWGKKEALDVVRARRQSAKEPQDMQWVKVQSLSLDDPFELGEFYVLLGTGPNPPEGWN